MFNREAEQIFGYLEEISELDDLGPDPTDESRTTPPSDRPKP